ncbi:2814_t:CDS:1, partial [Ambispora leptoticha]
EIEEKNSLQDQLDEALEDRKKMAVELVQVKKKLQEELSGWDK